MLQRLAAQEDSKMLRKSMLATFAVASLAAALAGVAPAQADWRGAENGGYGYERGHHDRRPSWRPGHGRRHHDGYGEGYRYGPPPWLRRWQWHWSRQAPPRRHFYGHPAPRSYW